MKFKNDPILYLAGPMSGLPGHNHAEFNRIASLLRERGRCVQNPAECDGGSTNKSWGFYMRRTLSMLLLSDEVVCLPGWRGSRGATIEVKLALDLGMIVGEIIDPDPLALKRVYYLESPLEGKAQETVLQEADRLVASDRQSAYGHPLPDFTRIGRLWAPILGVDQVSAEQVALCMIQVKVSRELHKPKRDNRVDMAGYAKCLDLVVEGRAP